MINQSAMWEFDGPGDGASPLSISPLNTINTAVDAGIVWVNAAGNQARGTWFKRNPGFTPVSGEDYKFLRFSGSDTVNADSYIGGRLELRWEDKWGSAETNLDLLIYSQGTDEPWLGGQDTQSGENGHYPYEYVRGCCAVDILIVHRGGPDPDWIQLVGWGGTRLTLNSSGAGSIINPAESSNPGMLAVGAAHWSQVNSIESYSSRGPTPDGRVKPDVVGAACGETATKSEPFCGTSQAAPHVAGMAALVRQRFPNYTPAQIISYLKENARQRISSPDPNNTWGHGFIILPPVAGTTVATAPAAPTALTATANGHTQINLSWTAPSDNGGAAISGYLIEVSTNGSTWSDQVVNTRSTSTSYTHSGLTAGNTRHYRVSAINSVGTGPASNVDNATTGAAPAPDLVVDTPTVDTSAPAAGARFTLSATVRNQGAARSDSTTLHYYRSTESTISTGDTEVGTDTVSGLNSSGSGDESISLTAPSTLGTYYYGACVGAVTGESDTTNNCSTAAVVVVGAAPAPDLVVDTPTVDASAPAAGARFTLNATVRNQGAARSTSITLRYYQSSDSTITTGDTEVGTDWVFRLDASESGDEWISLNAPSTPGTYYYGACVDEVAGELDTQNNCSLAVTVAVGAAPAPDLVVDTPTVSESAPASGASFTLSATVRNQGAARSASTTLRYYQSSDSTITTGDTEVGTDSVFGLAASWSGDESISLNAPSTPGTYYYGACVDEVNGELDTQNNCSLAVTLTVGAAPAPDLVVDTPTVSESAPASGARFTLSATVRNQGAARSASTTLRYYQSSDSTITTGDTEVGTDSVFGLAASWSGDEWISLNAPSTPGTYYYGACVDEVNGELDTQNNCSLAVTLTVGAAPAPELVVDTPTVDTSAPAAGARFTLSATVRNQGAARSDSTTLRYYRSTDSTISTGDTEVGTDSVSGLNSSGSGDESISLTAPSTPGTYYYGACVDEVSGESDTTNNCSPTVTVTVGAAPAPDLVVDAPTVSESAPASGASFTLSATVRNQGAARSDSTTLRYYQSTDSTITTGDTEVGTDSVFGLNISASGSESVSLTAPSTAGTYYYGACVETVTDESDTTNNCSTAAVVVVGAAPAPDLVVDAPTVSESAPASGASFTLSATVRNQGAARSASTTLRYYQSTDSTITTGDTEVGTDSVFGLAASWSGDESISLTAPSSVGTYYYGACVDAVSGETDTTNNCSSAVAVTVGAGPAPDLVVDTPTADPSAPAASARFILSATVRNQGNGSSTLTTLRYYRSTDSTITTSDTSVGMDSVSGLAASGSGDESVSLNAPSTPGTYYYGACVDAVSGESDTTNNCSSAVTVTVSSGNTYGVGDFLPGVPTSGLFFPTVVSGASLSSSGGNTTITFTNGGYIELQDGTRHTCQSTGGCGVHNGEVTQGTIVGESTSVSTSDLIVDPPTVSESAPAAGTSFTLNATVRNQGNGSSSSTTLRYYRSTDATITTSDTSVGTDSVSGLNASGSSPESISGTASSSAGTYYYGACVDSVASESDTTNNCSVAVAVIVGTAPAPDLLVDMPTVSHSSPNAGASFTLSATVRNQGAARSDSTTLRYYRSTDSTISTGDTEVGTDSVFRLDASESGDESIGLTAPSTPGTYYYGACVDTLPGESNAGNNCSTAMVVTVRAATAPDLVVDAPTVSESAPAAGAHFTLSTTVRNQGNGASVFTTLRYYQSTDSTITAGDTEVGTDSVSRLNASGSGDESVGLTAPSTLGTYYYGACVETVTGESDTTNNCSPAATVIVERTNRPPRLTGDVDDKVVELGERFTVDLSGLITDPDGDDITRYGFTYRTRGILTGLVNTKTGILSLTAIAVGETIVAVDAGDSNGASGVSEDLFKVTVIAAETAEEPGAPTGLSATADGQTEIDLSWTEPSDDGGADITGYKIEVSTNASSWSNLVANTNSTSTSYSHTGLTAGSTRHYRVSAINSEGTGTASNTDSATTDALEQAEADICATGAAVQDAANNPGLVADCEALLAAKDTLRGTATLNWSADTAITSWDAVNVSGVPRRITEIDTLGENLNLAGKIPSELGNLSSLTYLRLIHSELTGSIPSELGSLSNLTSLSLYGNQLTGSIPSELGSLSNLTYLNLHSNQLTGSIPSELGSLSNLTYLNLYGNQLTGSIPSELGSLSNLTSLSLYGNQLTGSIPSELGSLSNLTSLSLYGNQLTGSITSELGSLSNLTSLSLYGNQLTGSIPSELGSLSNLTFLSLSSNQLTGSIPSELGSLSNLTYLSLSSNQLTGSIPSELGSLSNLTFLSLSSNQLTGSIPSELGSLSNLTFLQLSSNQLTGSIPSELGSLSNLTFLSLSSNQLTGSIPSELGNLSSLTYLRLSYNELTGCIPEGLRDVAEQHDHDLSGLGLPDCTTPAPDLVVDTQTVSDSSLTAGDTFTLSFTVRNQGNSSSGHIWLRYYRSSDAEFDDDDLLVAQETTSGLDQALERNVSKKIMAHVFSARSGGGQYISDGNYYYIVCVAQFGEQSIPYYRDESDTTNNCSDGVAVNAGRLTISSQCIVRYVLTPLDECAHKVQGKFDVIYGEVDAFNSALGFIYYDFGYIKTITRSTSGSGPGNRQTTVHIVNWADQNWLVTTVLTSAGNERIIELRFWEHS